jgi:hypothetical protein
MRVGEDLGSREGWHMTQVQLIELEGKVITAKKADQA